MAACEEDGTNVMEALREFSGMGTFGAIVELGEEQVILSVDAGDKELVGGETDGEVAELQT